jgi:transcriptional regulator with XRE-family HTH domain
MYKVRQLRLEKGWNQNELAFHADLAPSVISQIETGKREPSATTLRKLSDALGVDIPDLFERENFPKAQAPPPLDSLVGGDADPAAAAQDLAAEEQRPTAIAEVHSSSLNALTKGIVQPLIEKRSSEIAEAEDNSRVPILWDFQLEAEDYYLDELLSDISPFVEAVNSGWFERSDQTRQASEELAAAVKNLHSLTLKALEVDKRVRAGQYVEWVKDKKDLDEETSLIFQKLEERRRLKGFSNWT